MKKGKENKPHIGIFGKRNNGKSSFINALAGQDIAIVSEQAGTTTDPVKKSIEIFGVGPVIVIDTAGIDDEGNLGTLRIKKTLETIRHIDMAIILITRNKIGKYEKLLIQEFQKYEVPFFLVNNKSDKFPLNQQTIVKVNSDFNTDIIPFSSMGHYEQDRLLTMIKKHTPENAYNYPSILRGIIKQNDIVLLITPIDLEAPEGRMILPQVQAIRDVLDNNCIAVVLKETAVEDFLKKTGIRPALAITDSQAFGKINKLIPEDIPLTGFSIMLAHYKGDFKTYLKGTPQIEKLRNGDKVLILESCTHQVNCDDIGRYKIPAWLKTYTGKDLNFEIVSGLSKLPHHIKDYSLVIQCGACMITRKQINSRLQEFIKANVPVTNYGMTIAYTHGIYERAIAPFTS